MACTITFNSDSTGSFYAGDIVTGAVILEFKNDQKFENGALPAGLHQYPFYFSLPADLPSSFESSIAKVVYTVTIKSKPAYKLRKEATFNVLANINLNHVEKLLMPSFSEFHKKFRNSGKFTICVKTYKAFAPKQTIPFEITIVNEKKVKITKINVILVQKIHYSVQSGYADEEKEMGKTEYKKFALNIAELCFFNMEIPQVVPSSVNLVDPIIDISYVFRVQVIFPFHSTLQEDIPVTVTTAPVIHYEF